MLVPDYHEIKNIYNCKPKNGSLLIACQICGEQYTGSTKTNVSSKANNYKSTQRKFVNKEAVPN